MHLIPLMHLLEEVKAQEIDTGETSANMKCPCLQRQQWCSQNGRSLQIPRTYQAPECQIATLMLICGGQ